MVKKPSRAKIEIIFFIVFSIFFRAFGVRFAHFANAHPPRFAAVDRFAGAPIPNSF